MRCSRLHDPGPCPVDDTPHTACVGPSSSTIVGTTSQSLTVPLPRPGWLPPVVPHSVVEFSTANYKRAVHGKALGHTKPKRARPR